MSDHPLSRRGKQQSGKLGKSLSRGGGASQRRCARLVAASLSPAAESVPQLEFQGCPTAWRCGVDSFVGTRQRWNLSDVSRHTSAAVLTRLRRQSSKLTNVNRPVTVESEVERLAPVVSQSAASLNVSSGA